MIDLNKVNKNIVGAPMATLKPKNRPFVYHFLKYEFSIASMIAISAPNCVWQCSLINSFCIGVIMFHAKLAMLNIAIDTGSMLFVFNTGSKHIFNRSKIRFDCLSTWIWSWMVRLALITVEWSRPPKNKPISFKVPALSIQQKYMHQWRASFNSCLRDFVFSASNFQ